MMRPPRIRFCTNHFRKRSDAHTYDTEKFGGKLILETQHSNFQHTMYILPGNYLEVNHRIVYLSAVSKIVTTTQLEDLPYVPSSMGNLGV